jgi:hypothetical protein
MKQLLCVGFIVVWALPYLVACTDNTPEPVAASGSAPALRGVIPAQDHGAVALSKEEPEWLKVSNHCSMTYIGSTSEVAFEKVAPAVRGKVLDCDDYYLQHHSYPTVAQLSAFQAAQVEAERKRLSPQDRRLRNEYAIGEALCQGNQTCVERGVEANQAIDKLEDELNADN